MGQIQRLTAWPATDPLAGGPVSVSDAIRLSRVCRLRSFSSSQCSNRISFPMRMTGPLRL